MRAHSLTTFVYQTFGQQFGALLLAGYGAKLSSKHRKLYFTETEARWVIELVTRRQPCRDEPLVLAALLKLLLSQPSLSQYLEFDLDELLSMLQWRNSAGARQRVETAIGCYVRLLYDKQVDVPARTRTSEQAGGGYYHLLAGYLRKTESSTVGAPKTHLRGVYFDASFIEGLKRGQVYFAGINFGHLQAVE
jgi:hypothetical protein